MKTKIALLLAFAAFGSPAFAKKITFEDLPTKVQRVIERNVDEDLIDDLSLKVVANGRRFVARLKLDGERDYRLTISSSGRILKSREDLSFDDLSRTLKRLIEEFLDDGDSIEIERRTHGSDVHYIIRLTSEDGDESEFIISSDGEIISRVEDIDFSDLTRKARRALRELVDDIEAIEDIERVEVNGEIRFRVVIEQDDVRTVYILKANGSIVSSEES